MRRPMSPNTKLWPKSIRNLQKLRKWSMNLTNHNSNLNMRF